jgi:cyclopropane-fatty-acyl-phospholipid synthase
MIEAVGIEFLDGYFEVVDRALKRDRGIAVFQVITMPEGRFERYRYEVDFIKKVCTQALLPETRADADTAVHLPGV